MFIGIYYHTLEAKGRLAVPAGFRKNLNKGSVITRGLDGCLFIFPASSWERLMDKLRQGPLARKEARSFVRLMTHAAAHVNFDAQGRTRLPSNLLDYAGIRKEVVIAGTLERIEVWDRDRYHTYIASIEKMGEELAETLTQLGI